MDDSRAILADFKNGNDRQKTKWSLKLFQALDGLQAYQRSYHKRAMERIERMRKAAGVEDQPPLSSMKL